VFRAAAAKHASVDLILFARVTEFWAKRLMADARIMSLFLFKI
jgi:hypothetical protein